MSTTSTPNDSPVSTPIQPLHNPSQAAHVVVPQAPVGNAPGPAPGMGAKALLAKKLAKGSNPSYTSPTDNMMTPCTQKLNAARRKQFTKGLKPVKLFVQQEQADSNGDDQSNSKSLRESEDEGLIDDGDIPF